MIDSSTYNIPIKFEIDDSRLADIERRLAALDGRTIRARAGVAGGAGATGAVSSQYRYIPANRTAYFNKLNEHFGRTPGRSNNNFLRNVNSYYYRADFFKRQFVGNMGSYSGWLRNIGNFSGAMASLGKVAAGVVPSLGALAAGIGLVGKAALAFIAISRGITAGKLWVGNRLLNSQSLGDAASNIMQFNMARRGLGGQYPEAFEAATRIAGEYGFSRVGMLSTINMLTGLNIGNRKINLAEATRIATIAGKITHAAGGNVPFERVNINLQQLLSQPTSSARDLRELIQAAPIIGKLAQQSMEKKNISGDVFTYLKDKAALLEVLNQFDRMVESNPFMKARGQVALFKENFNIRVVESLNDVWPSIAEGMGKLYDVAGNFIDKWARNFDASEFAKDVTELINTLELLVKGITTVASTISSIYSVLPIINWDRPGSTPGRYIPTWRVGNGDELFETTTWALTHGGAAELEQEAADTYNSVRDRSFKRLINENQSRILTAIAAYKANRYDIIGTDIVPELKFVPSEKQLKEARKIFVENGKSILQHPARYTREVRTHSGGITFELDYNALMGGLLATGLNTGNPAADATSALSDVTKGSRALIINFNKEIVSMPINIEKVEDGEDLGNRLRDALYENIVRGMQTSLANATGAM